MIRLFIDEMPCPLGDDAVVMPRYDATRLRSVGAWREGDAVEVKVLSTPEMDRMMHNAAELYRYDSFNAHYHYGVLEVDGVPIFEGVATLLGVERHKSERHYRILIRSGGEQWAKQAATTQLRNTDIEYECRMTLRDIAESWRGDSPVRFIPLRYDSYPDTSEQGIYSPQTTLMPHNYHPFLSVKAILESVLNRSGYTLSSDFCHSEIFDKLMVSGSYAHVQSEAAYAAMGFKAYRSQTNSDSADVNGRVYATMPIFASNIGAIVDTVSSSATDENDVPFIDAHTNGNCFTMEDGMPIFRPRREISTAFDYHLRYTTEYRMLSSSRLKGFDTIRLGSDCRVELELHNTFKDRRNELRPTQSYRLVIFDHVPKSIYKFGDIAYFSGDSAEITIPEGHDATATLFIRGAGDTYTPYEGDWAIYDGYVQTTGSCDIEVDIRTPYRMLSPSSPERFEGIIFEGAEMGQMFTLHSGCSVTPVFGGTAGYGEVVRYEDVAHHNFSQAELLEAVAHMFNLCIYSHKPSRTLYIESYDRFYNDTIVDLCDRQLRDEPIVLEEGVCSCYETMRLAYQAGDGVLRYCATDTSTPFGEWEYHISGYAPKQASHSSINPLFHPIASLAGYLESSPSAKILTVGDRDVISKSDYVEPRVVLYEGLATLPEGELWGDSSTDRRYPLAIFHDAELKRSLCFEDRDGCMGLHRFYDTELREMSERVTLRCKIHLLPTEYAALFDPQTSGANIRSLFRLAVGGDTSLFRLQTIEEYDLEHHVALCTFRRTMRD